MTITLSHSLNKDIAQSKVKRLLSMGKHRFTDEISNISERWDGYQGDLTFCYRKSTISANIMVEPDWIGITIKLPFILNVFKSKIKSTIEYEFYKE